MRVLVTAGPTREYLDDVRYISNASSGRMGIALAEALRDAGHQPVLVIGPVGLPLPHGVTVEHVETTSEMLSACRKHFPACDGVIAAAAVCDYRPSRRIAGKMSKTGEPIVVEMIETDDVLAELGHAKQHRWVVGFALEAANERENALQKLRAKNCDVVVLNGPAAIGAEETSVELIGPDGHRLAAWQGTKTQVARELVRWIAHNLHAGRADGRRPT